MTIDRSRRTEIVNAIVSLLKTNLNGSGSYTSKLHDNVRNRQIFWDEVNDYPLVSVYRGPESREYLPGNFKWAFLTVNIRIYVKDEDALDRLEEISNDIETVLDNNNTLSVNNEDLCTDIRLLSISDDEGLLHPYGVGEMVLQVQYGIERN